MTLRLVLLLMTPSSSKMTIHTVDVDTTMRKMLMMVLVTSMRTIIMAQMEDSDGH